MRGVVAAAAAVALAVAALAAAPVAADMWTHAYKHGEEVPVLVNTVGPFKNPTETYSYFEKLPVCRPNVIQHRVETLGEVMEGNRLVEAGYDVHFRGTKQRSEAGTAGGERREAGLGRKRPGGWAGSLLCSERKPARAPKERGTGRSLAPGRLHALLLCPAAGVSPGSPALCHSKLAVQ